MIVDQALACRVVLFDWTGRGIDDAANPQGWPVLSHGTECKGELMEIAWQQLTMPPEEHFVGFLDDDLCLRTSDINTLLAMARLHGLSAAQPALTLNSPTSQEYPWLRQRACTSLHRLPIVENQAPFIRRIFWISPCHSDPDEVCLRLRPLCPTPCAAHLNCWKFAAIDCAPMSHLKPAQSPNNSATASKARKKSCLCVSV